MTKPKALKPFPVHKTDEDAERFVETEDLSEYDFSGFRPMAFEFEKKATQLNMRLPQALMDAVKEKAKTRGIPFTRYVRMLMEQDVKQG